MLIANFPENCESWEHLKVIFRLQVSLYGADHEDDHIGVLLDEKWAGKVSNSLYQKILALSQIHGMNMRKRGVMPQHLDVDGAYQKFP